VPLENLALGPQCAFASTMEGNLLTEDEQWPSLRLVRTPRARVGLSPFVAVPPVFIPWLQPGADLSPTRYDSRVREEK